MPERRRSKRRALNKDYSTVKANTPSNANGFRWCIIPKGCLRIFRRFNAGTAVKGCQVPKGRSSAAFSAALWVFRVFRDRYRCPVQSPRF